MQIISVLTALVAFKLTAAAPSVLETGVVTLVTTDEIPEGFKISNETDIAARDLDKRATKGVYFCANANWNQPCEKITSNPGACSTF